MNSIWNKNIAAFTKRFPSLANIYADVIKTISSTPSENISQLFNFWQITQAKNGEPTVSVSQNTNINGVPAIQKLFLHSSYNPTREAQQAAVKILDSNKKTVIFLGCGLGYILKQLIGSIEKIILVEPDPGYFFGALYYVDWTDIFSLEQLVLAIGCPTDQIMSLLDSSEHINIGHEGVSNSYIYSTQAFILHAPQYFETVKTLIDRNKNKNDINAATYNKFAKLWIKNSLNNVPQLKKAGTVSQLKQVWNLNSTDFLVIAAGPSLETILPYMAELKKKMVLVCVETALGALLRTGIQPDFILLTDPQYWAYKHIAALQAPQSTLVCPLSVYTSVFRFKCRQVLLCSDMFPISQYYEKKYSSFGDLGAGGSVASSAFNLCEYLGAKNIFFAGLDLSYPTSQTHIKGSSAEQTFHKISTKLISAEKLSINSMYSANAEYGVNYLGQQVLTDARMKMFAWWFESRIAACPHLNVFTLCPQGLKIPGVKTLTSQQQQFYLDGHNSTSVLPADFFNRVPQVKSTINELNTKDYESDLKKLSELIDQGVSVCKNNSPDTNKKLSIIQEQINQSPLNEIVRLGYPSSKYMEENKTQPAELAIYEKLQKELKMYNLLH